MKSKTEFDFLNSDIWLKYTQNKYLPLEDIKYRTHKWNISKKDWPSIQKKILKCRKMGAVPFFLTALNKKFWYFPSDCIHQKIHKIESLGSHLFDKIENQKTFKQEFITNSTIEESITSAIYEGANSTRDKSKTLIAEGRKPKNKDEWMLVNNYRAMNWIKENFKQDCSVDVILKIHKTVVHNTFDKEESYTAGQFRDGPVYIGSHEGIPFKKIKKTLDEVIQLISSHPRFLHGLIQSILFHYFIAYIHPFFDGNGRTARTLFYFTGMKNNLKFLELLSISADLKQHGRRYETSFDLVQKYDLDLTYFIDFCLDSLLTAIEKVENKVTFLIKIYSLKEHLNINLNQVSVLQKMALNKYKKITIEDYAKSINKSREIARQELHILCKTSLLKQEKQKKKYIYSIQSKKLKEIIKNLEI